MRLFKKFIYMLIYIIVTGTLLFAQPQEEMQKGSNMIDLQKARARWISRDSLVWPLDFKDYAKYTVRLYYHSLGNICIIRNRIWFANGGGSLPLSWSGTVGDGKDSLSDKKLPYLAYLHGVPRIQTSFIENIPELLQSDLVISLEDKQGFCLAATRIQIAGIIDDLYAYQGTLGISWSKENTPTLRLWAPTARVVKLRLYDTSDSSTEIQTSPLSLERLMQDKNWTGVWYIEGTPEWRNKFYLYEVEVFNRFTDRIENNLVTDPYSISLATNSIKSQIVNLQDISLMPEGWAAHTTPPLERLNDISIYELHLRDFSIADHSIKPEHRGTYLAFTHNQSNGMRHLLELQKSGITHIHLLPTFDIATIEERRELQKTPEIPITAAPNSPVQQESIAAIKDQDGYNWGYDPWHYQTPEGSYSTNPEGSQRIFEFRQMVQNLHQNGFRIILDVVFNHTQSAGQNTSKSVLDRIVPGYYYRLNDDGQICQSSCCPDTATEHALMEKLMIDTIKFWAIQYRIDGFRFDLMGHHTTQNMANVRDSLRTLTMQKDGIDGSKIYIYGEAWKFGSLYSIMPGEACHQVNTFGLGIGSFNDRIRDAIRGGSPFTHPACQGFCNGLYYDYNHINENNDVPNDLAIQKQMLLNYMDNICIGLAGNLRDFSFTNSQGEIIFGRDIPYHKVPPTGYASQPMETINYVSVHDNHTLWDCIQAKAPFQNTQRKPATATLEERISMHNLAISLIALGQGIPFFQAGDELLRSKSGDGDSYNSGDWFNQLDFTYSRNNWGIGLPIADKNQWQWEFWKPRLADPELIAEKKHILQALQHFKTMLKIRKDSPLFRLVTAQEIQDRLTFIPTMPGVITMLLRDDLASCPKLDPKYSQILCIFNALPKSISIEQESWKQQAWQLHALLQNDPLISQVTFHSDTGTIIIPSRTTVVMVMKR